MVPVTGIEPVRVAPADFKSATSTSFVTPAHALEIEFVPGSEPQLAYGSGSGLDSSTGGPVLVKHTMA